MTPEGAYDNLIRILDRTEQELQAAQRALEEARKAEITAAVTLGILVGSIGTVIGACLLLWVF